MKIVLIQESINCQIIYFLVIVCKITNRISVNCHIIVAQCFSENSTCGVRDVKYCTEL